MANTKQTTAKKVRIMVWGFSDGKRTSAQYKLQNKLTIYNDIRRVVRAVIMWLLLAWQLSWEILLPALPVCLPSPVD